MRDHWLWYAVGRLFLYWLAIFAAFAAFAFSPHWINGWAVNVGQYVACGGFSLWAATMANLGHELLGGKR